MNQGEFEFIDKIKSLFQAPQGYVGIGDDCAIIPNESGSETLVSTDMLVEGSHFLREDITPYQLGWKSAAVNFSDIAAMGGSPVGSFLALALPKDLPDAWLDEFMRGYKDISERYGFPLLGGDTTASKDRICICVTVLGRCEVGSTLLRGGARPGDVICVTGNLGDSGLGLDAVLKRVSEGVEPDENAMALVERHYFPYPRVNEGRMLAHTEGVHAMMDISDGIASDLRHILEASQVGAIVDVWQLPISQEARRYCGNYGMSVYEKALCGGEDYELLFTMDAEAEKCLEIPHYVIGKIVEDKDSGLFFANLPDELDQESFIGFRHF